jgi:hypothetical protein
MKWLENSVMYTRGVARGEVRDTHELNSELLRSDQQIREPKETLLHESSTSGSVTDATGRLLYSE